MPCFTQSHSGSPRQCPSFRQSPHLPLWALSAKLVLFLNPRAGSRGLPCFFQAGLGLWDPDDAPPPAEGNDDAPEERCPDDEGRRAPGVLGLPVERGRPRSRLPPFPPPFREFPWRLPVLLPVRQFAIMASMAAPSSSWEEPPLPCASPAASSSSASSLGSEPSSSGFESFS